MRKIARTVAGALLGVVLMPSAFGAFDENILRGEWASVESRWIGADGYQYLKIEPDFSGVLSWSYGKDPQSLKFGSSDVQRENGFLVVSLHPGSGLEYRLVVSGFRSGGGAALMTGTLFMYQEENGQEVLFNSMPFRLFGLAGAASSGSAVSAEALKARLAGNER